MIKISLTLPEIKELDAIVTGQLETLAKVRGMYGRTLPSFPKWEQKLDGDRERLLEIQRKLKQA